MNRATPSNRRRRWAALLVCALGCSTPSGGQGSGFFAIDGWQQDTATTGDTAAAAEVATAADAAAPALDVAGGSGSDASSPSDAGSGGAVCAPGGTQLCWCTPKLQGVQICKETGAGWGSCACEEPDTSGGAVDAGGGDPDTGAQVDAGDPWNIDCLERAKHIYVLTQAKKLIRFEADQLKLVEVGTLTCPFKSGHTPFSMAVDRDAVAWVLDQPPLGSSAGTLFKVSTLNASCMAVPFQPGQWGFELFGMGFSSNGPGSKEETLFVAGGGASDFTNGAGSLGSIKLDTLVLSPIGKLASGPGSPELTGNGAGQLFGFFPATSPPSVRQILKANAGTGKVWPLSATVLSNVQAWAFAQWGTGFYLFFKSQNAASSSVHLLDAKSGLMNTVIPNTGHVIVGAGVSSCAPTKLD